MKTQKFLIFVGIFLLISFLGLSQVKELDWSKKTVTFSSFAKKGRISIFIISTYGCSNCIYAKKALQKKYSENPNVDIYYCLIATKDDVSDWSNFKKTPIAQYWANLEGVNEFPVIYVYGPTRNLRYKYNGIGEFDDLKGRIDTTLVMRWRFWDKLSETENQNKTAKPKSCKRSRKNKNKSK